MIAFVCEYKCLSGYNFGLHEFIAFKLPLTWIVLENNCRNYRMKMEYMK